METQSLEENFWKPVEGDWTCLRGAKALALLEMQGCRTCDGQREWLVQLTAVRCMPSEGRMFW